MPRSTKHPAYRLYRRTGQAVVTLNGRDHYLGKHGTKVSRNTYDRLVGEWLSGGRTLPADESGSQLTVTELLAAYLRWAKQYHPPKEIAHIKIVSRALKEIYGRTSVRDFGPLALKVVRQRFVDQGRVRGSINDDVARIRRIFKWGTENELLPASVLHALQAVSGLRRGRTEAPEGKGVKPVPQEHVDVIRPYVSRQVWAIVQLQCLTGMRPGEVLTIRSCDLDTTGKLWLYRPASGGSGARSHAVGGIVVSHGQPQVPQKLM